jgi:hypothetical protein
MGRARRMHLENLKDKPLGQPRYRWPNNTSIKESLREVRCDDVDWICLTPNRVHFHALVNMVMNLRVWWEAWNALTILAAAGYSRRISLAEWFTCSQWTKYMSRPWSPSVRVSHDAVSYRRREMLVASWPMYCMAISRLKNVNGAFVAVCFWGSYLHVLAEINYALMTTSYHTLGDWPGVGEGVHQRGWGDGGVVCDPCIWGPPIIAFASACQWVWYSHVHNITGHQFTTARSTDLHGPPEHTSHVLSNRVTELRSFCVVSGDEHTANHAREFMYSYNKNFWLIILMLSIIFNFIYFNYIITLICLDC